MSEARVILSGSERKRAHGAKILGPSNPTAQAQVTVYVRGKEEPLPITHAGHYISADEYASCYGATANDFLAVRAFAEKYNLQAMNESALTRSIELHGTVADLSRAFGVTLSEAIIDNGVYRHREGHITIPESLVHVVRAVLGLDNRPTAKPRVRSARISSPHAAAVTNSPLAIGQLYNFPPDLDGTGQTIAIIELGGGFLLSDLNSYFRELGLQTPSVTAVSVNGGLNKLNNPTGQDNADDEVALDIQIAGALAPGAKQVVYFAGGGDAGFIAAVAKAIAAKPQPAAISISWGGAESQWTTQLMQQFDSTMLLANKLGIPVCVASGDDCSFDATSALAVDFPSSSPNALGCGGTNLVGTGSTITSETVWHNTFTDAQGNVVNQGTGGGVSQVFPKPTYQGSVSVPAQPAGTGGGRGVPDVAGDADPDTGYTVFVKGANKVVGGTSAVAPLWAALIARFAQKLGKPVGFLQPLLYASSTASALNDITKGDNDSNGKGGLYQAGPGWDACTGLGTPNGVKLLAALASATPTQTPTPGSGSTGSTGTAAHLDFPALPPPIDLPPPVAPLPPVAPAGPGLGSLLSGGGNPVAIVGIMGLAAVVGIVAATGMVATVALARDKQ